MEKDLLWLTTRHSLVEHSSNHYSGWQLTSWVRTQSCPWLEYRLVTVVISIKQVKARQWTYYSVEDLPIEALLRVVKEYWRSARSWNYLSTSVRIFHSTLFMKCTCECTNLKEVSEAKLLNLPYLLLVDVKEYCLIKFININSIQTAINKSFISNRLLIYDE